MMGDNQLPSVKDCQGWMAVESLANKLACSPADLVDRALADNVRFLGYKTQDAAELLDKFRRFVGK